MAFPWLASLQGTAAVQVAARRGLLDALARDEEVTMPQILADLLVAAGVLRRAADPHELTPTFAAVWQRESEQIKAAADFILGAAQDIAGHLDEMVFDLPRFMQGSRTFGLFSYDKAMGTSPANLAATRPWVSYLESLARHEAPKLVRHIPLGQGERLLEVGGNTGLMAAELTATYEGVSATIFDLPAVCALGAASPWAEGLSFHAGDARQKDAFEAFRGKTDVILFKSVLHDWPEPDVRDMLGGAIAILPAGGRIVVCERGDYGPADAARNHTGSLANLVFAPFYRRPDLYREIMQNAGLSVMQTSVDLDMTFYITTGLKT